ncbi:MAG: hypothetical protein GYA60_02710 [Candidatus Methanofastidiosa archaeon]|nr:hypothetical protein [Candidatus Methanofastidiosa archaeon]
MKLNSINIDWDNTKEEIELNSLKEWIPKNRRCLDGEYYYWLKDPNRYPNLLEEEKGLIVLFDINQGKIGILRLFSVDICGNAINIHTFSSDDSDLFFLVYGFLGDILGFNLL